jgi:hypothetical protein
VLGQKGQRSGQHPAAVPARAAIHVAQTITNAFSIRFEVKSWHGKDHLEIGPDLRAAARNGYRLAYRPRASPGLERLRVSEQGGGGASIAEAEDHGAVGDHRPQVALPRVVVSQGRVAGDFQTGRGVARRIGERQIPLRDQGFGSADLQLPRPARGVYGQNLLVGDASGMAILALGLGSFVRMDVGVAVISQNTSGDVFPVAVGDADPGKETPCLQRTGKTLGVRTRGDLVDDSLGGDTTDRGGEQSGDDDCHRSPASRTAPDGTIGTSYLSSPTRGIRTARHGVPGVPAASINS